MTPKTKPKPKHREEADLLHKRPDVLRALELRHSVCAIERAYEVPRSIIDRWKAAAGITVKAKLRPTPEVGQPLHLMP